MTTNQLDAQTFYEKVRALVEPVCRMEGMTFVHAERLTERTGLVVRLSIDKPGGVTIDDCVQMSRQVGDLMDVHLTEMGPYRLEVSSPGPNRPLHTEADYKRFSGHRIAVQLKQPVDGRKRYTGLLKTIREDRICMEVDSTEVQIPRSRVAGARLAGPHGE